MTSKESTASARRSHVIHLAKRPSSPGRYGRHLVDAPVDGAAVIAVASALLAAAVGAPIAVWIALGLVAGGGVIVQWFLRGQADCGHEGCPLRDNPWHRHTHRSHRTF